MDAFLTSTALVALAEMGDKTQLLAILLASRLRRPMPIIAGIFVATIANHFLAALAGHWVAGLIDAPWFRTAIALGFVAMAIWTLVPDKMDDDDAPADRAGAFVTTLVAFFLVEMGDKTQVATVALGAQFANVYAVTACRVAGRGAGKAHPARFHADGGGSAVPRHRPVDAVGTGMTGCAPRARLLGARA
jgi:putative Ca2+/H+ antiporter (TMEM165/GDT1 family)